MNFYQLIEPVVQLFVSVDQRDWELAKNTFAAEVILDYSSMGGGEPQKLNPEQILEGWKGVLPGFESTHHQLGNFLVKESNEQVQLTCYGTATHYLPNEEGASIWTVVGAYEFNLKQFEGNWKITLMKFNFKYQDGNVQLVKLAQERLQGL